MTRLFACIALLLVPATARAGSDLYEVSFAGVVSFVPDRLDDGTFAVGAEVAGSFRIDAGVADSEPSPSEGRYDGAASDRVLDIGGYEATASTGLVFVRDAEAAPFVDNFYVDGVVSGATVAGLAPGNFIFSLGDSTLQALSDDAIPASLDLADFDGQAVSLFFPEGNVNHALQLTLTALSYLPAPEPAPAWLLAAGALTLGALRRRPRGPRDARS